MKRLLLICLLLAALVVTGGAGSASAKPVGWLDPGGVAWDCNYQTQACAIGARWVHVWHNGWYPEGGFLNYRWNMTVHFTVGQNCTNCFNGRPSIDAGTSDERFVDHVEIIAAKNYYYGCTIDGVFHKKGCYFAYRKAHVSVTSPVSSVASIPAYPWVKVWICANGEVLKWDFSKQLL